MRYRYLQGYWNVCLNRHQWWKWKETFEVELICTQVKLKTVHCEKIALRQDMEKIINEKF